MQPVLQLTNVSVSFETPYGEVEAVRDVSWSLNPGEVLAAFNLHKIPMGYKYI